MQPSPTQADIFTALRQFLLEILPAGTKVRQGQPNRVSEPSDANFVIFTPLRMPRLSTNVDGSEDAVFTGSIVGPTLTVSNVQEGTLAVGRTVFGTGLVGGTGGPTKIVGLAGGTGGVGAYTVAPSNSIPTQRLAAGALSAVQSTMVVIQLDLHGPDSADMAQTVSTLFYDDFAVRKFIELGDAAAPLFATDPRQMPFVNENQQVENRWVVELSLQANPAIEIPQQFADVLQVAVQSVDAEYPP